MIMNEHIREGDLTFYDNLITTNDHQYIDTNKSDMYIVDYSDVCNKDKDTRLCIDELKLMYRWEENNGIETINIEFRNIEDMNKYLSTLYKTIYVYYRAKSNVYLSSLSSLPNLSCIQFAESFDDKICKLHTFPSLIYIEFANPNYKHKLNGLSECSNLQYLVLNSSYKKEIPMWLLPCTFKNKNGSASWWDPAFDDNS
jgi:hypothetical protein